MHYSPLITLVDSTPQSSLSVSSIGRAIGFYGSSYVAQVWVYLPSIANEVSVIRAAAVSGANVVSSIRRR